MLQSGTNIDEALLVAIGSLNNEIFVLDKWKNKVDVVAGSIEFIKDEYGEEYHRKVDEFGDFFFFALSELRKSAEEFLSFGKLFNSPTSNNKR